MLLMTGQRNYGREAVDTLRRPGIGQAAAIAALRDANYNLTDAVELIRANKKLSVPDQDEATARVELWAKEGDLTNKQQEQALTRNERLKQIADNDADRLRPSVGNKAAREALDTYDGDPSEAVRSIRRGSLPIKDQDEAVSRLLDMVTQAGVTDAQEVLNANQKERLEQIVANRATRGRATRAEKAAVRHMRNKENDPTAVVKSIRDDKSLSAEDRIAAISLVDDMFQQARATEDLEFAQAQRKEAILALIDSQARRTNLSEGYKIAVAAIDMHGIDQTAVFESIRKGEGTVEQKDTAIKEAKKLFEEADASANKVLLDEREAAFRTGVTRAAAAELRAIESHANALLSAEYTKRNQARIEKLRNDRFSAIKHIEERKPFKDLTPEQRDAILQTTNGMKNLTARARQIAEGSATISLRDTRDKLYLLWRDDKVAFAAIDFSDPKYRTELSDRDYRMNVAKQDVLDKDALSQERRESREVQRQASVSKAMKLAKPMLEGMDMSANDEANFEIAMGIKLGERIEQGIAMGDKDMQDLIRSQLIEVEHLGGGTLKMWDPNIKVHEATTRGLEVSTQGSEDENKEAFQQISNQSGVPVKDIQRVADTFIKHRIALTPRLVKMVVQPGVDLDAAMEVLQGARGARLNIPNGEILARLAKEIVDKRDNR